MIHAPVATVQQLGRSLMLPIAVLPVAGLLLRLGQPDLLDLALVAHAGEAIFRNLPLLFAIGVALGFAKDNAGVAGLAGAVGHLVLVSVSKTVGETVDPGVLGGIGAGLVAGTLYNRYGAIRLPEYLAFFGGKRFVPLVTGLACVALGAVVGLAWPPVQRAIDALGLWLIGAGAFGLFVYGFLNRLLLVTGLHHVLNSLVWFVFGTYETAGKVVTGDLNRFFAGDPTAGAFMTGFFPVMMFGLPAACAAMYVAAPRDGRARVGGLLLSMALTSFLTGVTEPIEFTFLFLAPRLFAVHAVLTGLSMVLLQALHVRLGFTFSAGAFDYVLSYGLSTRGWMLIPVGLAYAATYFGAFYGTIRLFDLATPGRERDGDVATDGTKMDGTAPHGTTTAADEDAAASAFVAALGGAGNILSVDACTTRLRVSVVDEHAVRDGALKRLGAKGVVRPAAGAVQVVLGPEADRVADAIRGELSRAPTPRGSSPSKAPFQDEAPASKPTHASDTTIDRAAWVGALGGTANVRSVEAVATTRLRVEVARAEHVDAAALTRLGARGVTTFSSTLVHVILGEPAAALAAILRGETSSRSAPTRTVAA